MPTRIKVALTCLYAAAFGLFALSSVGIQISEWAVARFGAYPTLMGFAAWVAILSGSFWLINKINRDWPTLSLPPEPAYSPAEAVCEAVLISAQIDVRSVGSRAGQHPVAAGTEQTSEKC